MSNVDKVRELANNATGFYENYTSGNGEYIHINYVDDDAGCFFGTGTARGDEYRIEYEDVDLEQSKFFKLIPMN